MKGGDLASLTSNYSVVDMFLGRIGGSLGEVSALMLLLGGVYLVIRKVISWQIPVAYIGTVAILTLITSPAFAHKETPLITSCWPYFLCRSVTANL
jgi:Na+-translocating ferredoxin:NAD+ oxidoreductase RnfD subunit